MSLVDDIDPALLRPDDPDGVLYEAVANIMWPSFIDLAWRDPDARKEFTAATGTILDEQRSPMARMIDDATGYGDSVVAKFVEWMTVEHYGVEYAPRAVRVAIAAGTFGAPALRLA